jgi:hypothetical protein
MIEATVGILVNLRDNASAGVKQLSGTIENSRGAIRELATGFSALGTTFLGLGVAMQHSNSATTESTGRFLSLAGGIMTAVGSALSFVSSVGQMVAALKTLQIAQIGVQAFSGPKGWASLAIGLGAAAVGTYAFAKSQSQPAKPQTTVRHEIYVSGPGILDAKGTAETIGPALRETAYGGQQNIAGGSYP